MQGIKRAFAVAVVFAIIGAFAYVVSVSSVGYAAASTTTDMANLTTSMTSLMMGMLPLVVTLMVLGFIFGMIGNMFNGMSGGFGNQNQRR